MGATVLDPGQPDGGAVPRLRKRPGANMPETLVAKVVRESHAEWLSLPGQKGQKHNDNELRRIKNDYGPNFKKIKAGWMDKYLEKWDLLG
jgi:hypothetical protein